MPTTTHTGSLKTGTAGAAEQAKAIGATIGGDGWWYKDGKRLTPAEADRLTQEAGVAQTTTDDAHGEKARDLWGAASDAASSFWAKTNPLSHVKIGGWLGDTFERNKGDIWAGVGTLASGGNPLVGAAIKAGMEGAKRGASGLDALKGGISGYGVGSGVNGLTSAATSAASSAGDGALDMAGHWAPVATDATAKAGDMGIMDTIGNLGKTLAKSFQNADGSWNWDKVGSTVSGAVDAVNKNKTTTSDIAYKQKMAQLTQDAQAMNDQQFAAKYGMDKSAAKAQVDEFNQNFGLASSQVASAAQGRMNTAGVRDQSTFMLQKLLGASPTAFHGRDLLAGGADALKTPGGGGALDAIKARAAAAAAYQPGMGGVKTTVDQGIIDKYANPTGVTYNDPGSYAGKTATAAGGYTPPTTPPVTPPVTPPAPQVAVVPPKITDTLTPGGDTTAKPTDTSILNTNAMDTLTDEDPATKARRLLTARLGGMA